MVTSARGTAPAQLPPAGLPGLRPEWSRLVEGRDAEGQVRTWHVLDTGSPEDSRGTLLCLHGNPTWSYLWRDLLARAEGWRVIAPDHLDMGFSERTGTRRTLAQRIGDVRGLVAALELTGRVVVVGHDWGGVIAMGWAESVHGPGSRPDGIDLDGIALCNTAASHPAGAPPPGPLQVATAPGVLPLVTSRTDAFLRTALALTHPRPPAEVQEAYRAPYRTPERRQGIEAFVADVPTGVHHPTQARLDELAADLVHLADVDALLLWGPKDPVFTEHYLRDLRARLPHAVVHRFEGKGHLLPEDADVAGAVLTWLAERGRERAQPGGVPSEYRPLWRFLEERADSDADVVVEVRGGDDGPSVRRISWRLLHRRTTELAAGLAAHGVLPGQRVSLLVPPGADLTAVLYACLRIGAVAVIADAGLGVKGLTRAVNGAGPDHVIGIERALLAARALRWPGRRIAAGPISDAKLRLTGATTTLLEVAEIGARLLAGRDPADVLPPEPDPEAHAAIFFTSGSTGPAKGVVYTHRQMALFARAMGQVTRTGPDSGLVTAFAPFALMGPALGATCVVPDMDVTKPRTLTAAALADAVVAGGSSSAFLSPAAMANVIATAGDLDAAQREALAGVRTLLSAGAPVHPRLQQRAKELMPLAEPRTPYGATEVLPATDISLAEVLAAGEGEGICVGLPLPGVTTAVAPLDADGAAAEEVVTTAGVTGEVCVRAEHVKDHYDQLWLTQLASTRVRAPQDLGVGRWHRTGDVGHLDEQGRLWIEGRLAHIVVTGDGVVTPVGIEQRAETVDGIARAALVGVGPRAARQLVVVAEANEPVARTTVAAPPLARAVRAATGRDLAAVLLVPALPTDVRHNSKIDRARVAEWAERVLAGERGEL
ncbi:acyl-CoA synthetase (AMP-forming)/AMP-acid ligase II [Kineococcus xinjiangensis]|uniref:Acyl-CoA synthetase (AMP-forming)/AMP-acid ligase II n=1 Tax=Kineococcus xinjiangensis TaxID=512762 RepID=A0A2S6IK57_9ACTN|nr:alpha/beta fold hydrolase [Kineococcus xinjiangensis]PPK94540.1 acyl-CoA synthetase (AMP-forming)/AMP-acid ligase II [Kineococcus xinjiangensis]